MPITARTICFFLATILTACQTSDKPPTTDVSEEKAVAPTERSAPDESPKEYAALSSPAVTPTFFTEAVDLSEVIPASMCTFRYGCLEEEIYPIGWSKDGKFAYVITEPSEAVEIFRMRFIIQDTETDKLLVNEIFDGMEEEDWREEDLEELQEVWEQNDEDYNEQLKKHGIVKEEQIELRDLEWTLKNTGYSFTIDPVMRKNELFEIDVVGSYDLRAILTTQDGSSKRIDRNELAENSMILRAQPLGAFASPFEQRIVVMTGLERRGWEGPPNLLKLRLTGCRLD